MDGVVINLNVYGATVRLDGGELASASVEDVEAHRAVYARALERRTELTFEVRSGGRRATVVLAPQIIDEMLEDRIAAFQRSNEGWELDDAPPAHVRHFLQKKRRAKLFESKPDPAT